MNPIVNAVKKLVSGGSGQLIEKIGDALDKNITNTEEKMKLQNELAQITNDYEAKLENEVSRRWEADMNSDNSLSKNTRPIVMLSLLAFTFIIIICDSLNIQFEVKESYISLLETLLITTVVAYFGSRGIEKIGSIRNKNK